jgi:hypothetical protein
MRFLLYRPLEDDGSENNGASPYVLGASNVHGANISARTNPEARMVEESIR